MTEVPMSNNVAETDWLATESVFYNTHTGATGSTMGQVLADTPLQIDPEGLYYYLRGGYVLFGTTPVRQVRFLPANHRLVSENGQLAAIPKDQAQFLHLLKPGTPPDHAVQLIQARLEQVHRSTHGTIALPLSGGHDSRLVGMLFPDKSRLRAYTYGVAYNTARCQETVRAQWVASQLGIHWQQVELGRFFDYAEQLNAFNSVTAGGIPLYHMEFFDLVRTLGDTSQHMLSGMIGDMWAGTFDPAIHSPTDLLDVLTYNHTIRVPADALLLPQPKMEALERTYEQCRPLLTRAEGKAIVAMQTKVTMLTTLRTIPARYGMTPHTPLAEQEIALAMLSIPAAERKDRMWQIRLFDKYGLLPEKAALSYKKENYLNIRAALNYRDHYVPLETAVFKNIISEQFIQQINSGMMKQSYPYSLFFAKTYWAKMLGKIGVRGINPYVYPNPYVLYYMLLKPLQDLLKTAHANS